MEQKTEQRNDVSPPCADPSGLPPNRTHAAARGSALESVRTATAESHRLLEAMPVQARLLAQDYSAAEYRCMLERMYGFYEPLGHAIAAHEHAGKWGLRVADRVELLRSDLAELGLTAADLSNLERCTRLPLVDTADRALGCAYVLEGATLGGRVIFKHLMRVFPDRAAIPLRFFAGDGDRTAESWRRFCGAFNASAADVDEVSAAACAAFDSIAAWLNEPLAADSVKASG
jgi:heme oxygenase